MMPEHYTLKDYAAYTLEDLLSFDKPMNDMDEKKQE